MREECFLCERDTYVQQFKLFNETVLLCKPCRKSESRRNQFLNRLKRELDLK